MSLDKALKDIQQRFGPSIVVIGAQVAPVEVIPTGSLALDIALGVGGIPRGRITEIYGPEASGKTTLCLSIIAQAQKRGGVAAFIDVERGFDPAWAAKCGVDLDELCLVRPHTAEQALEIAEALMHSGAVDVVAIDSTAALMPRAEIEGEMGDHHVGLQARLLSRALRRLTVTAAETDAALIFTCQMRRKTGALFERPETTTGGMALKFYASVRLELRRVQTIKRGREIIGSRIRAIVKKNKLAPPLREAEFDILYDEGIFEEDISKDRCAVFGGSRWV